MKNHVIKSQNLSVYNIIHGTSTKFFGNMSINRDLTGFTPINRQKFFDALGINPKKSQIIFPGLKQSSNIALIYNVGNKGVTYLKQNSPEIVKLKKFPGLNSKVDFIADPESGIDACISNSPNLFIAILPADCAPVFLFDCVTGYYALIHAGVLGALSNIIFNTIKCLNEWCGTKTENLIAYIGPAISAASYDLKKSGLWHKVLREVVDEKIVENFDLKLFIQDQLLEIGVKEKNIEVSNLCTATNSDLLFSNYSAKSIAEKQSQGRHMSIIGKL
ncbi:MAG: polyphenol oxidase family protein [Candidatus Falkowbacteria bacterium]